MPADQALATAAPPDDELTALRLVEVPDVRSPHGADDPGPVPYSPPRDGGTPCAVPAEPGQPSPHQFALLIVETLAGVRPVRQLAPLLSKRAGIHLHRLLPLFGGGRRPRVLRVLTSAPASGVIEMTLIVAFGPRARALAVRLEQTTRARTAWRDEPAVRWLCTAIEAA